MPGVVFDSCIFISRKPRSYPAGLRMSAVVVQELAAGAPDRSQINLWKALWNRHQKENTLLIPTGEDWWEAGRILHSLLHGLKTGNQGRTPKLDPAEKQRIVRDVLIARTAKRAGAILVTDNIADFQKIRRYCAVRIRSGAEYFGY